MIPKKYKYNKKIPCSICGKEDYTQSSVKIHLTDTSRHYQGSGRPMVGHYSMKLCKKHYKRFEKGLEKIIKDLS